MAELAAERNIALVSDEIYREFCYDGPFVVAGPVQSADDRDRRLFQELRDDRLAAWASRTGRPQ